MNELERPVMGAGCRIEIHEACSLPDCECECHESFAALLDEADDLRKARRESVIERRDREAGKR